MKQYKKWPLALAVCSALTLTGCIGGGGGGGGGNGSDGGGSASGPTPGTANTTTLSGAATKGVVLGGLVSAYYLESNGEKGAMLAQAITSAQDGSYQLVLPPFYNKQALLIEVTSREGTLIRCDLAVCVRDAQGNATVRFGGDFPAPPEFRLLALTPGVEGANVAIHPSALTSVAADLAVARLRTAPADPSQVARIANAQIANRFGLTQAALLSVQVIDITNPQAVAQADEATLKFSLISAAIADAPGKGMLAALAEFIGVYTSAGIADTAASESDLPTVEKVLSSAAGLVSEIEAVARARGLSLPASVAAVKTEIRAAATDRAVNGWITPSRGNAPDDIGVGGLGATKQLVQQIRDLSNLALLEENAQAFADEVRLVGELNNADIRAVNKVTGAALRAIGQAVESVANGSVDTSFNFADVIVTRVGNTYSVKQVISTAVTDEAGELNVPVNVDLAATAALSSSSDVTGDERPEWPNTIYHDFSGSRREEGLIAANVILGGSVVSNKVRMEIAPGSKLVGSLEIETEESWTRRNVLSGGYASYRTDTHYEDTFNDLLTLRDLSTALDVTLVADSVNFVGRLAVDLSSLRLERKEFYQQTGVSSHTQDSSSWNESHFWSANVGELALTVSGKFSDASSQLNATATIQLANAEYRCEEYFIWSYGVYGGGTAWSEFEACFWTQPGAAAPEAYLTLLFDVNLQGAAPIKATVNARNRGVSNFFATGTLAYENGMSLGLFYGGKSFQTNETALITNHNGAELNLANTRDKGWHGHLSWHGEVYGLVDSDTGAVRVRYNDSTFEMY